MPEDIETIFANYRRALLAHNDLRERIVRAFGYGSVSLRTFDTMPKPVLPPAVAAGVTWEVVDRVLDREIELLRG